MKATFTKLFPVVFLFTVTLFLVACSTQSITGNIVGVDSAPEVQVKEETLPAGSFCQKEKLGVTGRDASGQLFEYKNECIGRIWYHSYTCEENTFKAHNEKCTKGCNLFGCEE